MTSLLKLHSNIPICFAFPIDRRWYSRPACTDWLLYPWRLFAHGAKTFKGSTGKLQSMIVFTASWRKKKLQRLQPTRAPASKHAHPPTNTCLTFFFISRAHKTSVGQILYTNLLRSPGQCTLSEARISKAFVVKHLVPIIKDRNY